MAPQKRKQVDLATQPLFPNLSLIPSEKTPRFKRISEPIWTEHKAKFIKEYLKVFVQITHHGAYIDGFAGPQYRNRLDAWTAKLVMSSDPKWLRHFFLCDKHRKQVQTLEELVASQAGARDKKQRLIKRFMKVYPGDFNITHQEILASGKITQKEATFCLLDQRTFECHWNTVVALSRYKIPPHNKIEILYFLGVGWLHRAFSGQKKREVLRLWWGRDDFDALRAKTIHEIVELVRSRFTTELGYKHVGAYPIFDRERGNRVMYYMIHASDHKEAPALMVRSHRRAVRSLPKATQLSLELRTFVDELVGS